MINVLCWLETRAGAFILGSLVAAAMVVLLASCGDTVPRSQPPVDPPGVSDTLARIGSTLAWVGGISAGAGVALTLISFAAPSLAPFAAIFRFAAVGGVGVTGTGAAAIWLSDNLWTLSLGAAASVGVVVWWYWPGLVRLWRRRMAWQDEVT